jgi:hypothetical protein
MLNYAVVCWEEVFGLSSRRQMWCTKPYAYDISVDA